MSYLVATAVSRSSTVHQWSLNCGIRWNHYCGTWSLLRYHVIHGHCYGIMSLSLQLLNGTWSLHCGITFLLRHMVAQLWYHRWNHYYCGALRHGRYCAIMSYTVAAECGIMLLSFQLLNGRTWSLHCGITAFLLRLHGCSTVVSPMDPLLRYMPGRYCAIMSYYSRHGRP